MLHGEVTEEGMLQVDDRLPQEYRPVLATFLRRNELGVPGPEAGTAHSWVLVVGHTPHALDAKNGWVVLLVALFLFNAWWLVSPLLRRG
jgi:hypothetical protein